jgi:hypothetical protein
VVNDGRVANPIDADVEAGAPEWPQAGDLSNDAIGRDENACKPTSDWTGADAGGRPSRRAPFEERGGSAEREQTKSGPALHERRTSN